MSKVKKIDREKLETALKKKFKPSSVSITETGYKGSLVYTYINDSQGIYEVGEVNSENCKNAYPYAMALKRCIDRVILKSSRLAYSGIYSDSEAEEFKKDPEEPVKENINVRAALLEFCKDYEIDIKEIAAEFKLNNDSTDADFKRALDRCYEIARARGFDV